MPKRSRSVSLIRRQTTGSPTGTGTMWLGLARWGTPAASSRRLVRGKDGKADLGKIPKAFFDCNAYVSMGFFAATLIDALVR